MIPKYDINTGKIIGSIAWISEYHELELASLPSDQSYLPIEQPYNNGDVKYVDLANMSVIDRPDFSTLNLGVTAGSSSSRGEGDLFVTATFTIGYYPVGSITLIDGIEYYADSSGLITWNVIIPDGESYTYTANIDAFPYTTGSVTVSAGA